MVTETAASSLASFPPLSCIYPAWFFTPCPSVTWSFHNLCTLFMCGWNWEVLAFVIPSPLYITGNQPHSATHPTREPWHFSSQWPHKIATGNKRSSNQCSSFTVRWLHLVASENNSKVMFRGHLHEAIVFTWSACMNLRVSNLIWCSCHLDLSISSLF